MNETPLFLSEATLSLYPTDSDGNPIMGSPIWFGALATGLGLRLTYEGELSFASGDRYKKDRHLDELHLIEISRNWFIRQATAGELAQPQRNTNYALDIIWATENDLGQWYWHRRQYFGVTARSLDLGSAGTLHFNQPQVLRAQSVIVTGGAGDAPTTVFSPSTPGVVQDVLFLREDSMLVGDYLMGTYRWNTPRVIVSAKAIGLAPQNTATTLTLEVGGVLTAVTLTLPVGAANAEVSNENIAINFPVTGGTVRWRVTAGDADPANAAWKCAVVMEVQ